MFSALNFSTPEPAALCTIGDDNWRATLKFCDSAGLTLLLYLTSSAYLPARVLLQVEDKLRNNIERWSRLKETYGEIASALEGSGIEFAVLKGFGQCPLFVGDPRHRSQYDIDLLLQREDITGAAAVAQRLGFEPALPKGRRPVVDHFPTLVRKTGWNWRGDYFDPDIPFSLELHFRCWDSETEGFGPRNLEELFWPRLCQRKYEDLSFRGLDAADSALYASLHTLRHLLHGNLRPSHVYELAWFLNEQANDDQFWLAWRDRFSDELQAYQAVCFALAQQWFSCAFHPIAERAVRSLPLSIAQWMLRYSHSPVAALFKSNKDELWLHWSLLASPRQRFKVLRKRLIPAQLPGPVSAVHLKEQQLTLKVRLHRQWTYLRYLWQRFRHHAASLVPTTVGAVLWFRDRLRDRAACHRAQRL